MMKMELIFIIFFLCSLPNTFGRSRWFDTTLARIHHAECDQQEFLCKDGQMCVLKHLWCDGQYSQCPDGSDEQYCDTRSACGRDYFKCDNGQCIPSNGECDGYPSCKDGSDELGCLCEEISGNIESIEFNIHIGKKGSKCWKIVVPSTSYLSLNVTHLELRSDNCHDVYFMIETENYPDESVRLCPDDNVITSLERFGTTEIRYHGTSRSHQHLQNGRDLDSIYINLIVEDLLCKRSDSFKCADGSCIPPERKCDGINDCWNGADELGCETGVNAVPGVTVTRNKGISWLKKQRNAAWGWRDNTHRAVTALYLAQGANFNGTDQQEDLTAKQLELQMTTAILRNETEPIPSTQLAMYVNALLVICHDPRNFYGYNLVRILQNQAESSKEYHPLPYLALCNANAMPSENAIAKFSSILESSSGHTFLTDVQSVAVMALSCLSKKGNFSYLESKINETTHKFKQGQNEDGSFGNIYTTALVVQALLSSGEEEAKDWDLEAAIEFLQRKQNKANGSFDDFLATTLILPILNGKSLSDISQINCTENLKMPRDGNPVSDIELRLSQKISIKYYLYIGNKRDQVHPIFLRTPTNVTVLDVMRLAAEADPKYRFQAQNNNGKLYIYKIYGISNDPEDGKFWLLYTKTLNATLKLTSKSPDTISVNDKDEIVMWYRPTALQLTH